MTIDNVHTASVARDGDTAIPDEISELLLEGIQSGATLKDIKGISDEMLDGVYAYAYRFYQSGQLDEAQTFFRFLYMYDFYNGEYALGLAAVLQMKRDYAKAIDMYAVAYALLHDDERPMFHVGQCHLALRKTSMAKGCFEIVVEKSRDAALVAKAEVYLNAIASGPEATTKNQKGTH